MYDSPCTNSLSQQVCQLIRSRSSRVLRTQIQLIRPALALARTQLIEQKYHSQLYFELSLDESQPVSMNTPNYESTPTNNSFYWACSFGISHHLFYSNRSSCSIQTDRLPRLESSATWKPAAVMTSRFRLAVCKQGARFLIWRAHSSNLTVFSPITKQRSHARLENDVRLKNGFPELHHV